MLTRITPWLRILFVISLGGCVHANTTAGAAGQADRAQTIPLSTYAGLLRSITVSVANSAHPFIFDTGGGETMITPDLASAIDCTPYGRAVGLRASGEQVAFQYCDRVLLRLGDIAVAHDRVGVFDLKAILPAGAPPTRCPDGRPDEKQGRSAHRIRRIGPVSNAGQIAGDDL